MGCSTSPRRRPGRDHPQRPELGTEPNVAMIRWFFLPCGQAMKRSGLVLGSLPFITGLCVAGSWVLPVVAQEPAASSPAATTAGDSAGLSDKEKALLQKLNALKTPRWRPFGPCQYDWSAWRLLPDGVRITSVQCGGATVADKEKAAPTATGSDSVAVHCDSLKLSIKSADQPWSSWRLPYSATESGARGGEDLMVVALCANSKPIPKTQPATPPAVAPAAKPTAKPASKPPTAATQRPRASNP